MEVNWLCCFVHEVTDASARSRHVCTHSMDLQGATIVRFEPQALMPSGPSNSFVGGAFCITVRQGEPLVARDLQ